MQGFNTVKPATALHGEPASKTELLGCGLKPESSVDTLRAQYLAEIYALPAGTAWTVAELAFGEGG